MVTTTRLHQQHLTVLRLLAGLLLALTTAALVLIFFLPHRESWLASPTTITIIAAAMGLWFAFSTDRDARQRLEVIKLAFAVDGALPPLLRAYVRVYLVVLLRLQTLTLCGLLTAVWGNGPVMAAPFMIAALIMTARAWPTAPKLQLLLERVGIRSDL